MKLTALAGMSCLVVAGALAAQRGPGGTGGGAVSRPAGGHHPGSIGRARYAGQGRIRGYGYGLGYTGLYDEPFYDAGGYYPQPDAGPSVVMAYPPPAAPAMSPVVPVIHEYNRPEDYGAGTRTEATPSEGESSPILYLIAFQDKNIHAASTYWIEGGTLHYLDADHKELQAPLASVDRQLSTRLNRERHVPFNLP